MTATLCPVFQEPQFTDNDEFLVGGLLWFYEAGSSTLATAYTTNVGDVAWSNPIVLDSRGESGGTIWLDPALSYRIVLESKPYYGQTHGVVITEHDDITGVPVAVYAEEWVAFAGIPTYVSTTSFTVLGDFRDVFVADRKLLITSASVETIHSVTSSSFGSGVTTVNVTGSINSNIATVAYSFITPDASPNRFENVTITNDLTVSGDTTIDGNVTIGGTASVGGGAVWTDANNTASLLTNGYQKFNSGVIIQWGISTSNSVGVAAVTLPTAFTASTYVVTATARETASTFDEVNCSIYASPTTTSFSIYLQDGSGAAKPNYNVNWIAIGH